MKTQTLTLTLNSPAFLGDASQSSVWRTPPIKALLREWWRIATAPRFNYEHQRMRESEGLLFGNAWLEDKFCKSQVRIALQHWHAGKPGWDANEERVRHPEVPRPVGSQLYLGYGPLIFANGGTKLKKGAALQAGEKNSLDIAYPDTDAPVIEHALLLIDWFGTFGGRSRNAWGSLTLAQEALTPNHPQLKSVMRDIKDCLSLDWPHALGHDEKGALIWESQDTFPDWKAAMTFLARIKIGFRTQLPLVGGEPHQQAQERHLLAYPVSHHKVAARGWGGDGRIANQLRFKLFRDAKQELRARLYHTPHQSPLASGMSEAQELAVWQKIHIWLDQQSNLQRLGAIK